MSESSKARRVAVMLDLQWPYKRHADIFAGTQQYAESQNWQTIIDEFAHDALPTRRGRSIPYDGVIARATLPLARRAAKLGIPVVNVWASSPARNLVPGVFPDSTVVGRLCAEHLLSRGFRSFATLTSPRNIAHRQELREFSQLIDEAGFPCNTGLVTQNPWRNLAHWRETERSIERWIAGWEPPIGVYVGQEGIGRMVAQACQRRGWRVPADVAIIAGQNEETLCEHPRPSLTSVEMGFERIGYEAAQLLERLMDGESPPADPVLLPPEGLIVRDSTDFFAVDDELVAAALRYISANSHRRIGPDNVARFVNAETRTLQNRFKKFLGRPIATEIRRVRTERAKRELVQSRRPLSAIARDVGFGKAMRMYEVFRRELGVSPSEYRKQRQLANHS